MLYYTDPYEIEYRKFMLCKKNKISCLKLQSYSCKCKQCEERFNKFVNEYGTIESYFPIMGFIEYPSDDYFDEECIFSQEDIQILETLGNIMLGIGIAKVDDIRDICLHEDCEVFLKYITASLHNYYISLAHEGDDIYNSKIEMFDSKNVM